MTPSKPSAVTHPTLSECIDWLQLIGSTYFESVDTSNPKFHEYRRAILAHLRTPAPVLGEGEREALEAGAIALVVDAHDWRKLILELPEDKTDCARWMARSDQSENRAATLRSLASRLTTAQGGEDE